MKLKKVFAVLMAATVTVGGMGLVNGMTAKADGGKVVFAYWGAESENNAIQKAVDDFRANNPDIEVETQWIESNYLTKVQTQIAGETMADVYLI